MNEMNERQKKVIKCLYSTLHSDLLFELNRLMV